MNVTVENLAPCKKLVRVEVDAQQVDKAFDEVTKDFQKKASLPGFRPGKAPLHMVLRRFEKDIQDEVKRKLISESYKKATDEQDWDVLGYPDIEEIQFGRSQPLQYAATVETSPEFELPEYKGIPVRREARSVTDDDVVRALEALRQQRAHFQTVTRPVQTGDYAVVNYTGTVDGKPITELSPSSQGLTEKKNFWLEMGTNTFIPGFAEQLQGAQPGEKRTVQIDFPADFVSPELAGKHGVYETEVVEVKEKVLPPLDDALAAAYGAKDLAALREGVQKDLQNELQYTQSKTVRAQILTSLVNRVNFELPETAVAQETKNVVYDIVQQNTKRGITRDSIEEHKDQIYSAATQNAKERVKIEFLLRKIAEKEKVGVSQEEISSRIVRLAVANQMAPEKLLKDLQQRNGLIEVYDQIMKEKVMDLLEKEARVEEVPPGTLEKEAAEARR